MYLPGSGGRSFEENQGFFDDAKEAGTWRVNNVKGGIFTKLPYGGEPNAETTPLLSRVEDQLPQTGEVVEGVWGSVLLCLCISSTRAVKNALKNSEEPEYQCILLFAAPKTPLLLIHFSSLNQYCTTSLSLQNY